MEEHTSIVGIRVLETQQREHGWSDIRVIGPCVAVTEVADTRSDQPEPCGRNFRLNATMVPRKCISGSRNTNARRRTVWRAGEEKIVRMGEHYQRGRPLRVGG